MIRSSLLQVVMPAYNEAKGIQVAVKATIEQVIDRVPDSQLLVYDDGSSDDTGRILGSLAVAARKLGYPMIEIDVRHYLRQTGESTIKKWKLLVFCWKVFEQLLQFRARLIKGRP